MHNCSSIYADSFENCMLTGQRTSQGQLAPTGSCTLARRSTHVCHTSASSHVSTHGERSDKIYQVARQTVKATAPEGRLTFLSACYVAFSLVMLRFFLGFLPPRYSPRCTVFKKFLQPSNVLTQKPANSFPGLFPWEFFICWIIFLCGTY